MTFKSRLIKITKKTARIADIIEIDLSSIPEDMDFDQYIKSNEYKVLREKLFKELIDDSIKTKFVDNYKPTTYKLIDDTQSE